MKKLSRILNCIYTIIKKKFSNGSKGDISHNCENMPVIGNLIEDAINADNEEYLENYKTTTRWQTL